MQSSAAWYYRPSEAECQHLPQLARAVREAAQCGELAGVWEAIPGYASLYLEYDPARLDLAHLQHWVSTWQPRPQDERPPIEVPVVYDGEDLAAVASRAGLSPQQAAEVHASVPYTVRALGFVAGFPFMETTPAPLQAPRRATPRPKVSAHSLAVAGTQTGIYPVEAPGGWNLLGHTLRPVYDPRAEPPFLLQPGDWVRFVPREGELPAPLQPLSLLPAAPQHPVLQVQKAGLLDLVMDLGRVGQGHLGLVRSGAQDAQAARLANQLLGNAPTAPLLEMHLKGPELRVLSAATLACTGGLEAVLNGQKQPPYSSFAVQPNDLLQVRSGRGRVGYLALSGGLEACPFLGSSSSDLKAGLGLPIQAGELLGAQSSALRLPHQFVPYWMTVPAPSELRLRLLPVTTSGSIDPHDLAALHAQRYALRDLDRMAARLETVTGLALRGGEIRSEGAPVGTIQVPPSGEAIILLHDKGTMGGYHKPARVHPADLPKLVQAQPGTRLRFVGGH